MSVSWIFELISIVSRSNLLQNMTLGILRGFYFKHDNTDIEQPIAEAREWKNNKFNFDDVGKGMLTLFAVSTFEGWPQ